MATLTVSNDDEKHVKALGFLSNKGTDNFNGRVITRNGKITAAQMRCIANAAEQYGNGQIEFTTRLTAEVAGIPYGEIENFRHYLEQENLVTGGTGAKVRPVVSCKGTTCQFGLYDTFALSEEIHERFFVGYGDVKLPHKFKIAVGGCPNNCVKPNLNDVGIIGQRLPQLDTDKCKGCGKCAIVAACPVNACAVRGGKMQRDTAVCTQCGRCVDKCYFNAVSAKTTGYKIVVGGRWGNQISMGHTLGTLFTSEAEVLSMVEKVILLFRSEGYAGERLAVTLARVGFDYAEKLLMSDELLRRKDEILAAEIKTR